MADITLSKAVRSNLLNLQSTAAQLGKTQERLATGLKVNSALDNPTNFFTASSLNSRASDLGQLLDSVSNAVQTIAAADKGISAITKLVESAQATARQALQTAATVDETTVSAQATSTGDVDVGSDAAALATGTVDLGAATDTDLASTVATDEDTFTVTIGSDTLTIGINDSNAGGTYSGTADVEIDLDFTSATVDALISAIDTALSGATAQGINASFANFSAALDGSNQLAITTTDTDVSFTTAETTGTLLSSGFGIANGDYDPTNTVIGALSGTLTFTTTDGTDTLTFGSGNIENRAQLETALAALSNSGVTASIDGSGFLTFDGADGNAVTVGGTIDAETAFGIAEQAYSATSTTAAVANPARAELVTQYNSTLDQIDQLASDSGFNGVNLLNGDSLSVLFNENGTSSLDITGVTYDASGIGLDQLASTGFDTDTAINATLNTLKTGIDTLRSQSSKFGANLSVVETRQDFTKNIINVLQTGASNLTLADSNEEAANLLALQTRQQLSTTALSLASQADQNVLRLF